MKKLNSMLLMAFTIAAFTACSGNKDSKETADSINDANDSVEMASTDSAAGGAMSTADDDDAGFATAAANGGMAEVELGKLAAEKGMSAKVKEFGQMMASDHTKAGAELMALAQAKNIALPATLADPQQKVMADISKKSGKDFDNAYVDQMIEDHEKTVKLFEDEAADGKDAELKAFASKTLPTLRAHLDMINKIKDGMK